jgi:hypothetical protein
MRANAYSEYLEETFQISWKAGGNWLGCTCHIFMIAFVLELDRRDC